MNLLAIGLSHRSADVRLLERAAVAGDDLGKLLHELIRHENVVEALLLSTCNRIEVYAVVEAFHAGLTEVSEVLGRHTGASVPELADHLYVHYAAAAVEHLFSVAAGLDSMVVGEAQILGQLRAAYAAADEAGTVGRVLHELTQHALRVGKRVHSETGIDRAGASVVSEALADAGVALGGLAGRRAIIVGAGSMGGLAAAHLRRSGIGEIVVVNRTVANAERLAATIETEGTASRVAELGDLAAELAAADLLLACTGATDIVVDADTVRHAVAAMVPVGDPHPRQGRPLVICDLGLPRDIDASVAELPGVVVVDLETLQRRLHDAPAGMDTKRAYQLVLTEVREYLAAQRSAAVTPTVTALRRRAAEVVDAELLRLNSRLPQLDAQVRVELASTVRRVVDKLLHMPTVRVKELASAPGGASYADALRELFALDPQAPAVVTSTRTVESAPAQDGDQ